MEHPSGVRSQEILAHRVPSLTEFHEIQSITRHSKINVLQETLFSVIIKFGIQKRKYVASQIPQL